MQSLLRGVLIVLNYNRFSVFNDLVADASSSTIKATVRLYPVPKSIISLQFKNPSYLLNSQSHQDTLWWSVMDEEAVRYLQQV